MLAGSLRRLASSAVCGAARNVGLRGRNGVSATRVRLFSQDTVGHPVAVNILENGEDPVELEDSEYPDWLWSVTEEKPSESEYLDRGLETLSNDELGLYVSKRCHHIFLV